MAKTLNRVANKEKSLIMAKEKVSYKNWEIVRNDDDSIIVKKDAQETPQAKPELRAIAQDLKFDFDPDWITQQLGRNLINVIQMKNSRILKIDGRLKVNLLKKNFKCIFGATLRVKVGNRIADENARLSDIRKDGAQSVGDFAFPANMTVGTFQESMSNIYGLQVIVATCDNWVASLEGLTLEEIGQVKKQAVKADMQAILDARLAREATLRIEREGIVSVAGNKLIKTLQTEFSNKFTYLALCFIVTADRTKSVGVHGIDTSKTIADVRTKTASKELSIDGHVLVKNIEEYFWNEMGIACQVGICNYGGHPYYFPLGEFNNRSLSDANRWAKDAGCKQIGTKEVDGLNKGYIF